MRTKLWIALMTTLPLLLALGGCGESSSDSDGGSPPDASGTDAGTVGTDAGETGTDGGPDTSTPEASMSIAFSHFAGGAPIVLGTDYPYTDAAGDAFGVARVSYFVSLLTLTLADGTEVQAPGAHYVDLGTPETLSFALPVTVPTGELRRISFVMGLPPELNVTGAFTSPPESLMEWPVMMGGGYHYMKLEGRYLNAAGEPFNFMAHSGGLRGVDYSFEVVLDATGREVGDGATFTVEMNVEQWFTDPDVWDLDDYFNETHRGIMGDADAQASLQRNGATVFTLAED